MTLRCLERDHQTEYGLQLVATCKGDNMVNGGFPMAIVESVLASTQESEGFNSRS